MVTPKKTTTIKSFASSPVSPPRRLNLAGSPSRLLCWHPLQEGSDSSKAYHQDWSSSPLGTWMGWLKKKTPRFFDAQKKAQETCVTHITTVECMSYIILYNIYIYRYEYRYILYKILECSSTNRIAGSLKVKVKLGSSGQKNSDHSNSLWNPGLREDRKRYC